MAIFKQLDTNKLSSVEQEVYRYIVNHLSEVPYMRVRDIAKGAHVSPSSVFRFIQKAGYESFPEFKLSFKTAISKKPDASVGGPMGMKQRIQQLSLSMYHPDIEQQLTYLASRLSSADCILFVGMGASGALGNYCSRKLASLGYFSMSIDEMTYPVKSLVRDNQ